MKIQKQWAFKLNLVEFGPLAQIGKNDDEEKPLFASLLPNQLISKITFEEALKLLIYQST